MRRQGVLWVSTSMESRGGIATYVRTMQRTPLWDTWQIRHIATHRNGSVLNRVIAFLVGAVAFLRELVLRRPAVVHLHTSSYGSFARKSLLAWAAWCARVPIVVHVHGSEFSEFHRRLPRLLQRYVRATLESADLVIALGKTWEGRLRQIAPDARIAVVPNAVAPRSPVHQAGPGEPVHVLFLGEIEDNKGSFLLLDAWRSLSDGPQPPGTDLVLAGGGDVSRARVQVAALGIGHEVRVPGWVAPAQVEELLETSHVLVLPSRFEGQPMAVLEAMAHGLCVVASDVGGIPDLVDDGVSGVLIPPDDRDALVAALRTIVDDSERRARLGACAWARVRDEFDVDVTWRQLDALYADLTR